MAAPANAIVGGNPTTPELYPYFVRLHVHKYDDPSRYALCGGSVVDAEWVLTAAHCMTGRRDAITVDAFVGDTYRYAALELKIHPLWNGDVSDGHDLALLRIPDHATNGYATPAVAPVQVGTPSDPGAYADKVFATALGHGATSEGSPTSDELRDLRTPLHTDDYMDNVYNKEYWVDNWKSTLMIGAGWTNRTLCSGDSGGPLTVDRAGRIVQVGVASFVNKHWYNGDEACNQPAGFAELSGPQLAWVAATLPSVASRWGTCAYKATTPGRWRAMYVAVGGGDAPPEGSDWDGWNWSTNRGAYAWKIFCEASRADTYEEPAPTPTPTPHSSTSSWSSGGTYAR